MSNKDIKKALSASTHVTALTINGVMDFNNSDNYAVSIVLCNVAR